MTFTPVIGTGFELATVPPYVWTVSSINSGGIGGSYFAGYTYSNSNGVHDGIGMSIPVALSEIYFAVWMNVNWTNSYEGLKIALSTGHAIELRTPNTGYYDLYINGAKVASGTIPTAQSTWTHFQMHVRVADSGLVETRINGYPDISYSGDTQPAGAATISYVCLTSYGASYQTYYGYADNMIVGTDDWPGDFRYQGLMPSADTATAQLTPTPSGAHYSTVNERGPNDSTYVFGSVNGYRDVYDVSDWVSTLKTPIYVVQHMRAYKINASTQGVKFIASVSGSEDLSSAIVLTTAPANYFRNLLLAPDGGAWDATKINNLQIGAEVVF